MEAIKFVLYKANILASLKTYLFLSFIEDPEFFGGEELKVR